MNPEKCAYVTFTLRKSDCDPLKINNVRLPQHNHVKYLDRRLISRKQINAKLSQITLKCAQVILYLLIRYIIV